MKNFTKVMLILAGVFATAGVACMIIAFVMGFTTNDFVKMFEDGDFSIQIQDGEIKIFGLNESLILEMEDDAFEKNENSTLNKGEDIEGIVSETETREGTTTTYEIEEVCNSMDIEFGAGVFEVYYTDVENIVVEGTDVDEISVQVRNNTLEIRLVAEVNVDMDRVEGRKLVVQIPKGTQFETVDIEIGASQADIRDILAKDISITIGAGQANVTGLTANQMELEVGAGLAVVDQIDVRKLDVEAGLGEVNIVMNGVQEDYNYNIECGIGSVTVGNMSYGGFAAEKNVINPGATKEIDVECGMGEVTIQFKNII